MPLLRRACLLLLAAALTACASGSGNGAGGAGSGPERRSDLITAEEIQAEPTATNVRDLIRKLHPAWLTGRGAASLRDPGGRGNIVVYMDETQYGGVETLARIPTAGIRSIRYLTPSSGGVRMQGSEYGYIIQIRTRD